MRSHPMIPHEIPHPFGAREARLLAPFTRTPHFRVLPNRRHGRTRYGCCKSPERSRIANQERSLATPKSSAARASVAGTHVSHHLIRWHT